MSDEVRRLRLHVLALRALVAQLPLTDACGTEALQAWFMRQKAVMEAVAPDWNPTEDELASCYLIEALKPRETNP